MNQCHFCHTPVGDDRFCSHCGQAQKCLSCGKAYEGGEAFCTQCGTPRATGQGETNTYETVEASQSFNETTRSMNNGNHQGHQLNEPEQGFQQNSQQKQPMSNKQVKIFTSIAAVAAIIFIYFAFFSVPTTPEGVVEAFFDAVSDQNEKKVKKYTHPYVHSEIDFRYLPVDAKFTIARINEVEISGNEAFVDVHVRARSLTERLDDVEWFYIHLEKKGRSWIIYDMY